MDPTTRILFTVLRTGEIISAKYFLGIHSDIEKQDIVRYLLHSGANVNVKDELDRSPLHYVVNVQDESLSNVKVTEWMIDRGADANMQDIGGITALHLAIQNRKRAIIRYLLDRGANVDVQDKFGRSPLHYVGLAHYNDETPSGAEVTKWLIDKSVNINVQSKDGKTALHRAIIYCGNTIIRLLLDNGASVDVKDSFGRSPLHYIAHCSEQTTSSVEVTKWLIDKGADINMQDEDGQTALHLAIGSHSSAIIRLLLDCGARVDIQDRDGTFPLNCVTMWGHYTHDDSLNQVQVAKWLIDKGADINVQDKDGNTVLLQAIVAGKKAIIRLFLDSGASVNVQNRDGQSPLHCLMRGKYTHEETLSLVEVAKWLIDKGADINFQDRGGNTALHRAIVAGKSAHIRLLVDSGASVNVQNRSGQSPIHFVVMNYHYDEISDNVEIAKILIDKSVDLNMQDENGKTALHFAVMSHNRGLIGLLLDNGVRVDVQDSAGQTVLHYITEYDLEIPLYITKVIISRTINVNVQDETGSTPVHFSIHNKLINIFSTLLNWGGSMLVEDDEGRTPYLYYYLNQDEDSLGLLDYSLIIDDSFSDEDIIMNKGMSLKCVLMQYIQRVKYSGLINDVELLNVEVEDNSDYHLNLLLELELMKKQECGWSCVYDVFAKYQDPRYATNSNLEAVIESTELGNKYLRYGEFLKSTFAKAKRRLVLLNTAVDCFEGVLPVEVRRKILSYLDSRDMESLITCYDVAHV